MTSVATKVLSTVNAPYGADLSACQLADRITDPKSADKCDASVFAFFSEVSPRLQHQFLDTMGVDKVRAHRVARKFAAKSGLRLALAA